jgi:hypothetical protein
MSELIITEELVDFWIWIDPNHWLTKHNISQTGRIFSGGLADQGKSNLMFIPNPEFGGDISLFNVGITNKYNVEYALEKFRIENCPAHPSRLIALFLLPSEVEAKVYEETHRDHVKNRILKKCHAWGKVTYSIHDSSWIDFLRMSVMIDDESLNKILDSYWRGKKVQDCGLLHHGEKWTQKPAPEVLLIGQVEFYDRNLDWTEADKT